MTGAVDVGLAFSEVFMVLVLVIQVLREATRRAADLLAGRNGAWPTLHGETGGKWVNVDRAEVI